ncbi:MAG: T9SS type A sorting domain-containing protein [Chitinophagales bacterium]|nr:T9SS type A sorting domain-containing protein [Chitinophagales bacterium]
MTGKVWYRSLPYLNKYIFPGDSIEKLVMDMSLQIGDTFEFGLLAGYYMAPVQTVTNVYVDQGRKHIEFQKQFSSNDKLSFIEGLSTSIGFVYKDSNKIIQYKDAYSGMLLCIYKDSMNVYRSPYAITGFPDACYPLNVNNIQPASPLSVYPNPSSGIFTINSPPVNTAIVVKDIDGRTVFEVPEQKQAKLSVDLTEYPKGVYFIQATSEYGSFYRKIVLR